MRPREARSELLAFAELAALTGFALAQPLFDVLGRSPDFFIFRDARPREILAWAVAVAAIPAIAGFVLEILAGALLGSRFRAAIHAAMVMMLLGVIAMEVLKAVTPIRGMGLFGLASALSGAGGAAYLRWPPVRTWLRYAGPAPAVFLLLFLLLSPTSHLVRPAGGGVEALAPDEGRPPIVMVVLDEFPLVSLLNSHGEVDDRVFPNFARLARSSTLYRNATGVSSRTPFAVPSMLTGRLPKTELVPHSSQQPANLFTWLATSHDLRVFESVTALCPRSLCEGTRDAQAPSGLGVLLRDSVRLFGRLMSVRDVDEDPAGAWLQEETERDRIRRIDRTREPGSDDPFFLLSRAFDNQPARFGRFLESIDGEGRPLHFLHLLLPHSPWTYLPSGDVYAHQRLGYVADEERNAEAWPALVDRQRHVLQVAYVDRLLGQILDRLESVDLFDRSLVIVTADHGIDFRPGPGTSERDLDSDDADEVAWIPLFMKLPGQEVGRIDDSNVMTVDLLPTLADVLDAEVPWDYDGVSMLRRGRQGPEKVFYNWAGSPTPFSADAYYPRVLRGVTDTLFSPEDGIDGLYRLGPHGDLVFTDVADLDRGADVGVTASLDAKGSFDDVTFDGLLPVFVTGQVTSTGSLGSPVPIAVSVNGVVGGVSELFPAGSSDAKFATMVPERLLKPGRNRVELFAVARSPSGKRVLIPIGLST